MNLVAENQRLQQENHRLREENSALIWEKNNIQTRLVASESKQKALLIERDFFVEQGRTLQNQLQLANRMHADLFDQLGRGVVTEESIASNLALASEELRQPLTSVEAIRGLTASMHESTQGEYSLRNVKGLMVGDDTPRGRR